MNTPPPEGEFPKPELLPSLSLPVPQLGLVDTSPPPAANPRRRRHTMVTGSDAAAELLSDGDDNEHDDQALDRISGILSTLLQEANDAVQNNNGVQSVSYSRKSKTHQTTKPRPRSALLRSSTSTTNYNISSSTSSSSRPKSILSLSRLPRPTRSTQYRRTHERYSSMSSSASSASLFSPAPTTAESPITASSVEQQSNYFLDQQMKNDDKDSHDYATIDRSPTDMLQPSSSYSYSSFEGAFYSGTDTLDDETRQPHDDDNHDIYQIEPPPSASTQFTLPRFDDPLMESFRRLDSSMAMVESLSRDLAQQQEEQNVEMTSPTPHQRFNSFISSTSTSKLALLFLPLLHIPHALITTVFDTLISSSSPGNSQTTTTWKWSTTAPSSTFVNASASFSGIVAWTLCFALANIVVTWSGAPSPYRFLTQQYRTSSSGDIVRPRRLSLPGSYQSNNNNDTPPYNNNNNQWEYSQRMERSKRPTPINTTLCNNNKNQTIRRTPIKRSTHSSSSTRKRISRPNPSSTCMAITQSNDRSYALAIQQSRAWKKQQQQQQQQQQIPDDWEWIDGGDNQLQPLIITRRRHSF